MSRRVIWWFSLILSVCAVVGISLVVRSTGARQREVHGAPIDTAQAETVELASVLSDVSKYVGSQVIVEGQVAQACQSSGCWLMLTDGTTQLFIQLYDFTVILAPGTKVRVQGELRTQNNVPYLAGKGLEVLR